MSEESKKDTSTNANVPANIIRKGSALESLMSQLPEPDRQSLIKKGVEELLNREAEAGRAEQRHNDSAIEMENALRHVTSSDKINVDQTCKIGGKTYTGEWEWTVTKNNNFVVIVVAIVIGVVAVLVLNR